MYSALSATWIPFTVPAINLCSYTMALEVLTICMSKQAICHATNPTVTVMQFLLGFYVFLFPKLSLRHRRAMSPIHMYLGRATFVAGLATMAVGTVSSFKYVHGIPGCAVCKGVFGPIACLQWRPHCYSLCFVEAYGIGCGAGDVPKTCMSVAAGCDPTMLADFGMQHPAIWAPCGEQVIVRDWHPHSMWCLCCTHPVAYVIHCRLLLAASPCRKH